MQITVQVKSVYGNDVIYPACPLAVKFAALAGTKTLTEATLRIIESMGVEITVEQPTVLRFRAA